MSDFHVVINCNSGNFYALFDCLGSIMSCEEQPNNITLIFNNYNVNYSPIFDIFELRDYEIIKTKNYISYNRLRNNIVTSCDITKTKFLIFMEDDLVVRDEDFFRKIRDQHRHHTLVRFSERMSGFSIEVNFLKNIPFDPRYIGEGFEDWDLYLSLNDSQVLIDPYLARHKRINPEYFLPDFNREYLQKKWDLQFDKNISSQKLLCSDCFDNLCRV